MFVLSFDKDHKRKGLVFGIIFCKWDHHLSGLNNYRNAIWDTYHQEAQATFKIPKVKLEIQSSEMRAKYQNFRKANSNRNCNSASKLWLWKYLIKPNFIFVTTMKLYMLLYYQDIVPLYIEIVGHFDTLQVRNWIKLSGIRISHNTVTEHQSQNTILKYRTL